jgi:gliding motility-associated-like protein
MPVVEVDLGDDIVLCEGLDTLLDAGSTATIYSWNTGATTSSITISNAGTYSVSASNGFCTSSDEITVVSAPSPADLLQDLTACTGQNMLLDAGNAGSSFAWSTGNDGQTISVSNSGTYSVTVTNTSGCSGTFDAVVQFVAPPHVDLGMDTVLCDGQVLLLDALNPGSTYSWSTGATGRTINVTIPGSYSVTVGNGYCQRSDTVTVLFNPSPERLADQTVSICLDDEPGWVMLDAGNAGASFLWSTGQTTRTVRADAYGWYVVEITNSFSCSTRDSVNVTEDCPSTFFAPNTFTPDGDGMNDVFIPVGKNIATMELLIFDRWGNLLFESRDPSIGWDGRYRGEIVKNDIYVWKARYRFEQSTSGKRSREQEQMGHIQVLR